MEELRVKILELEERLARLEARQEASNVAQVTYTTGKGREEAEEESEVVESILTLLEQSMDKEESKVGLFFAGMRKEGQGSQSWVYTSTSPHDCQIDPTDISTLTAPFSSPQRVSILAALAMSDLNASQLEEQSGLSGGQLYHHLRDLKAADLVAQDGRGSYRLTHLGLAQYMALRLLVLTHRNWVKAGRPDPRND